jgi:hypothetical protein
LRSAQQTYTNALAAHATTVRALAAAEKAVEQSDQRVTKAEQAYLDALGAPAIGTRLPFQGKRILEVKQRSLRQARKNVGPTWEVEGYLYEARDGQWIQVQRFEGLTQAQVEAQTPAEHIAHVQALLADSKRRARDQAKVALRLGVNEIDYLNYIHFAESTTTVTGLTGILFGKHTSLQRNLAIAEGLRRKGVITVPNYTPATNGLIPDWYRQPMNLGPRADEAKAILARAKALPQRRSRD